MISSAPVLLWKIRGSLFHIGNVRWQHDCGYVESRAYRPLRRKTHFQLTGLIVEPRHMQRFVI